MQTSAKPVVTWSMLAIATVVLAAVVTAAQESPATAVHFSASGITITPLRVPNFQSLLVQIVNPRGEFVVNVISEGEAVSWAPLPPSLDGFYRYEAVVHAWDPVEAGTENNPPSQPSYRTFGTFSVSGGAITPPAQRR